MGSPISQIQAPQTSQSGGKGQSIQGSIQEPIQQAPAPQGQSDGVSRPMGKGGRITYPGQTAQPQIGQPNRYSNTVGPWDNANIQQPARMQSGKGKGY